jgi:hypothetical protein
MSVNVPAYNLNGQLIKEFYGTTETPYDFYYGTGAVSQPSFELIQEDSFNIYFYRKTNTGQLYLMVVLNKYTPSREGQPGASVSFTISGLSSGYNIEFSDDSPEAFTIIDSDSISNTYAWQRHFTDGFVIELIEPMNTLTIDVTAYNNINQFTFIDNDEQLYTIPFSQTTQLTIEPTQITYDGDIYLDPPAGIYQVPKTINVYLSNDVEDAIVTDDGTTPTLAEYIAYDDLDPPNPFIAVVQDGRGNVAFDGGFPKLYNFRHDPAWSSFNDLSASFKYVYNVLDFIANKDKVQAGNNKILILGDANTGDNYCIKETATNDFYLSLEKLSEVSGYEFVYRTTEDYGALLDPSYAFLEEHVAVVLFSTLNLTLGNGKLSSQAIANLVAFRENGNGIFIITDHGSGSNGYYVTANQLASEYGAYFEGNHSRTPVNVGFLRTNYGDHPLYNNLLDTEDIYADASESRVFITEYPTYDNSTIPDQNLVTPGYTNYKFLIRDRSGNLQSLNYTYGLQVAEIVDFLNEQGQVITSKNIGVSNRAQIDFQINDAGLGNIDGLVKRNGIVVGDVFFDGTSQEVQYYRHDGNKIIVDDGDIISVEITSPLQYTKNLQIERFQPDVGDIYSYSRFLSEINNPEWFTQKVNRNEFSVLDNMNYNRSYRRAYNVERIRGYINNTGELPEATALVYSDPTQAQNALATVSEPTQQEIFNQFGIFAVAGATQSYYPTKADAPNTDPYSTWVYDTNLNAIVQTANTSFYTGFVSPEYLDRYVLEVTVTSPVADDDIIGVVAAHFWDADNGENYTISFDVNNGGSGQLGPIVANKNHRGTGAKILGVSNHDVTYANASGGNGWSGRRMRVKVERNQNIIKMVATKWDVLDTYDPASEIIIDLNADPDLSMFLGPKSYGYSTLSQPNSTFENISFTGGVNYDFVVDMQNQIVYRYNVVTLQWESTGITIQDFYGYPRTVRNPNTGETFYITKNAVTQIS